MTPRRVTVGEPIWRSSLRRHSPGQLTGPRFSLSPREELPGPKKVAGGVRFAIRTPTSSVGDTIPEREDRHVTSLDR